MAGPVAHIAATVQGSLAWLAWIAGVDHQRRGYATEAALAIMNHLATHGISAFAATLRESHAASEGVARNSACSSPTRSSVWRTPS